MQKGMSTLIIPTFNHWWPKICNLLNAMRKFKFSLKVKISLIYFPFSRSAVDLMLFAYNYMTFVKNVRVDVISSRLFS